MKRFILSSFAVGLLLQSVIAQQSPKVEVVGLQVIQATYPPKDPKEKDNFGGNQDTLTPFNSFDAGVSIAMLVQSPAGGLLEVDDNTSSLTSFTDDKGTKLFDAKSGFHKGFSPFSKISKDGKAALVTVEGKIPPAAGATKASAKGVIKIASATQKTAHKVEKVALKTGTAFKAGAFQFTITDVNPNSDAVMVGFSTKTDIAAIASFKFIGPDGKEVEADRRMTSSMGGFGSKTWVVTYELKSKLAQATLEIETWDDQKVIDVPFDVTVALPAAQVK